MKILIVQISFLILFAHTETVVSTGDNFPQLKTKLGLQILPKPATSKNQAAWGLKNSEIRVVAGKSGAAAKGAGMAQSNAGWGNS